MKRIVLVISAIVLTLAVAIGGTVAYLQDTDSDVNVMTMGNVYIEQIEQERDANGNIVEFKQAKPALPAVGPVVWDTQGVEFNGTEYKVFSKDLKNVVDKFVTVKNTGKTEAYIRTVVAIEAPDFDAQDYIHLNYNSTDYTMSAPVTTTIDGVDYVIFAFTYKDILESGKTSAPSFMQVFLDSEADNDYCNAYGDTWEILVYSQAVQAAGFASADEALNTAFGTITTTEHPWANTVLVDTNNKTELLDAITSGNDVILNTDIVRIDDATFNGNGSNVTLAGGGGTSDSYGYLAFIPEAGEDAKVENINVTGVGFVEVGHWGMGDGNYEVNNITIKDMTSTLANGDKGFTLGCTFCHYGDAVLNNCTMTGAKSLDSSILAVDAGFVNNTKTVVNGGEYGTIYCWSHAVVTLNGAKVDTLYAGTIKGTITVKAGTEINTIRFDYGTSTPNIKKDRLQKLVIEDGATVGEIIFVDKDYSVKTFTSVADWNNFVANY